MTKKLLVTFGVLMLCAVAAVNLGCGGNDADASTGDAESTGAAPAANSEATDGQTGDSGNSKKKKKKGGKDADDEDKEEAVPVEVTELGRGPIEAVLSFSANLEAENQVMVISQAKRLITELVVEEGDRVKRGQLLLRLQDDEQRAALAKVESQLAKAEREYERQQRLFEQQLISEEAYNNATYELEQLRISLQDAERELSYTEVRAPISGTITSRLVSLGDQVQIGQELFEIIDFDSIVARVYVPEKYINDLRTALPARVSSAAAARPPYDCSIKRIAPIVDAKSGTVKVTVGVGQRPGLRPGMYVDVDLITATHTDAVLVPKRALVYDNDQMFVYRLADENRVERVFIRPALSDKFNIEPQQGLAAGEKIVVAGQAGLKDGALVSLPGQQEETESGSAEGEDEELLARTGS